MLSATDTKLFFSSHGLSRCPEQDLACGIRGEHTSSTLVKALREVNFRVVSVRLESAGIVHRSMNSLAATPSQKPTHSHSRFREGEPGLVAYPDWPKECQFFWRGLTERDEHGRLA